MLNKAKVAQIKASFKTTTTSQMKSNYKAEKTAIYKANPKKWEIKDGK